MRLFRQILFGAVIVFLLLIGSNSQHFDQLWKVLVVFLLLMCTKNFRNLLVTHARGPLLSASAILFMLLLISGIFHVRIPVSTNHAIGLQDYYIYWLADFGPIRPGTLPAWPYEINASLQFEWSGLPFKTYFLQTGGVTSTGTWSERIIIFPLRAFIVLLVPTGLVWVFRPARIPGKCERCGYDLTGNTCGVCPECGTKITPTTASG